MAQYNKQTEEYVDRNNYLFDVMLIGDTMVICISCIGANKSSAATLYFSDKI